MHSKNNAHLKIKNSQDVLSLIKLIAPKDFKFFEIKKQEENYVIMCKKNSRSANVFYISLSNNKAFITERSNLIQLEIEQDIEVAMQNTTFNFCKTTINSVSNIMKLGGLYLQMFHLKKDKEKLLQLHKYFFN